jgi:hypothetical protein
MTRDPNDMDVDADGNAGEEQEDDDEDDISRDMVSPLCVWLIV